MDVNYNRCPYNDREEWKGQVFYGCRHKMNKAHVCNLDNKGNEKAAQCHYYDPAKDENSLTFPPPPNRVLDILLPSALVVFIFVMSAIASSW